MKKFFLPTFLTLAGMAVAVQAQTSDGLLFEQIDMTENYRVDIPEQDRFDDIIGDESGVKNLILKKLMQRYGCESLEMLGERLFLENFEASNNIRMDEDGLTFVYNPYEIGPYSEGVIEVTVKADEMLPLLTPYGKQILP